ncbi:fatty acyl-AMP ligase [Nonomuraea gerenzanensis]|uniref:Long-chain-fatty-acid--CoA ligase n=1 Tax=Nonomuraea gerenzanensis TaxID=93944 RepID=A0A1M4ER51_9ACTN|nr:fatty acyl-AMP ligase [Nonomuraea gerenzanensis]UBU12754.1 fatty acyl-AMP ligase [Nonomuraea gerenzanensis]SBP01310.1 Long-chain-fatty-acid--CoA ligase [Nonomuraea gerenzanensis]
MRETLIAQVARWARELPEAPAYTFVDHLAGGARHTLTWARADLRARALAVRLRELAGPGDRVAVLVPQGLDYVVAMIGAMYARLVAVPLFAPGLPGHGERLAGAYADADPMIVLTTTAALPGVTEFLATAQAPKHVLAVDTVSDLLADEWEPEPTGPGDLAYLQYTSGSTRAPAGVEITHGNLTANATQLWELFRARPRTSVAALWLPLFHDMGLVATVAMPMMGGNLAAFMDPVAFVMRPVRWLRLLSEFTDVFTAGPNFAYEYTSARVTPGEKAGLDLSGVRVMLNGAEPVRPGAIEAFDAAFAGCGLRPEAHTPAYGLAEATVFVAATGRDERPVVTTFDRDALRDGRAVPAALGSRLVSCGRPYGQRVRVVSGGRALPDGEVGEIWVRGPNVARAYWRDAARSAEVFGAVLEGEEGTWLRTGDLGVLHDGRLYVTGRIKDLVIVDGRNHYPQDIEATVQEAHPAVRRDRVAAFGVPGDPGATGGAGELLVVVAERARGGEGADVAEVGRAVRAAVRKYHELSVHDFVLTGAGTVPRTSSGKIARRACLQAYLEGLFV